MSTTKLIHPAKQMWVYNEETGSLTHKKLAHKGNDIEGGWYEEDLTFRTYDPFYVDEDKARLVARVGHSLQSDLDDAEENVDKIKVNLLKLRRHGKTR